jgi:hypothetical protein
MLRLSQLAALYVFLPGIPKTASNLDLAMAHARPRRLADAASNKIKFSYLNGNLMAPKIRPLTLALDRNSLKGGQRLFI